MSLDIVPIIATTPLIQTAVEAKTFDTWFLKDFRLVGNQERKFDIEVFWTLGRLYEITKEVSVEKLVEKTVSKPKIDSVTGIPILDENGIPIMENTVETVTETVMENVTSMSFELSPTNKNVYIRDILSNDCLIKHPEISKIMPEFLNALETIGKREGAL